MGTDTVATGKVVVYAGPTVSPEDVRAVLPRAVVRPPVARGDLLEGEWGPGDTAVVIDGFFRERRSVGHKEILWLLGEGVRVVGAASMGALRAAELIPFGMHGVGAIQAMFAAEEIDGDDEVGVLHGPAAMGYPPQTVALVNVRHGCRAGVEAALMSAETGRRIVEAVQGLPFELRTWAAIAKRVAAADSAALDVLRERIESGEWDLKRLDALAALRVVAAGGPGVPKGRGSGPDAGPSPHSRTIDPAVLTGIHHSRVLLGSTRHEYAPGRWMSDLDVLNAVRLFDADYPALHEETLSGLLADLAAARGLTAAEYGLFRLGSDGTDPFPDRLAAWLSPAELAAAAPADRLRLVMVRVWPVWQSVDWRPAVLARLRADERWESWSEIVRQADDAAEAARFRVVVPPPAVCGTLFGRHWRQPGVPADVEAARRGFAGQEELGTIARRYFAYDLARRRKAG